MALFFLARRPRDQAGAAGGRAVLGPPRPAPRHRRGRRHGRAGAIYLAVTPAPGRARMGHPHGHRHRVRRRASWPWSGSRVPGRWRLPDRAGHRRRHRGHPGDRSLLHGDVALALRAAAAVLAALIGRQPGGRAEPLRLPGARPGALARLPSLRDPRHLRRRRAGHHPAGHRPAVDPHFVADTRGSWTPSRRRASRGSPRSATPTARSSPKPWKTTPEGCGRRWPGGERPPTVGRLRRDPALRPRQRRPPAGGLVRGPDRSRWPLVSSWAWSLVSRSASSRPPG